MNFSVSIVIPNWNGRKLLENHLPRIMERSGKAEIIIADDGSHDDSVSFLQKKYPSVLVIQKKSHEGFSSTINAGVEKAHGDIVILLNTDIEPESGWIAPLERHFNDKSVFAVGCMDTSIEGDTRIYRGRGIGWWSRGLYMHKRGEVDKTDTDWVSGGSGAFRRSIWNRLGGMDTRFNPFYWEDIDLSYRAIKNGYRLVFEPKSNVVHYHEKGMILGNYSKNAVNEIAFRNQLFFSWKHGTVWQVLLSLMYSPIYACNGAIHGDDSLLKGFLRAIPSLPSILFGRI